MGTLAWVQMPLLGNPSVEVFSSQLCKARIGSCLSRLQVPFGYLVHRVNGHVSTPQHGEDVPTHGE